MNGRDLGYIRLLYTILFLDYAYRQYYGDVYYEYSPPAYGLTDTRSIQLWARRYPEAARKAMNDVLYFVFPRLLIDQHIEHPYFYESPHRLNGAFSEDLNAINSILAKSGFIEKEGTA